MTKSHPILFSGPMVRDEGDGHDGYENYSLPDGTVTVSKHFYGAFSAQRSFQSLWDSINAKTCPWESNPWVVAYTFEVVA